MAYLDESEYDDRPRDGRSGDDRSRDDRAREDRARDERAREERAREDRARDERVREAQESGGRRASQPARPAWDAATYGTPDDLRRSRPPASSRGRGSTPDYSYPDPSPSAEPYRSPYSADPYPPEPFPSEPYKSEPYKSEPYKSEPYKSEPYQPEPYPPPAYQPEPYAPQAYAPDKYPPATGADSTSVNMYAPEPYPDSDPYAASAYLSDPYPGGLAPDPYPTAPSADPYRGSPPPDPYRGSPPDPYAASPAPDPYLGSFTSDPYLAEQASPGLLPADSPLGRPPGRHGYDQNGPPDPNDGYDPASAYGPNGGDDPASAYGPNGGRGPGGGRGPHGGPAPAEQYPGGMAADDAGAPAPKGGRAGRNLPAAIGVGVLLGGIAVASLFVWRPAFLGVIIVAVGIGVWELVRAIRTTGANPPLIPLVAGGALMMGLAWWGHGDALTFGLMVTVLAAMVWRLADGAGDYGRDVTAATLVAVYVPFLAGFAALLAVPPDGDLRVLVTLAGVVLSDTGGYIAGVLFGRHPMAPSVSPKKSWEGLGGSLVAAAVGSALLLHFLLHISFAHGALFGLAICVAAVLGDLGESMLKRDLGVKDMSQLLPGHGGLMDRLDSILLAAPTGYLLLLWLAP